MSTPILATKLYIPPPRPNRITRPRLLERLHAGLHKKLTLISAPAGFGKTALVGEWVASCRAQVAWLSLDERDSDPICFLTYLVAALQTMPQATTPTKPNSAQIGKGVMALLQSPQPPRDPSGREAVLTALLNEIATISDQLILILDDYHLIDDDGNDGVRVQGSSALRDGIGAIDETLTFLLDHLPPQMHLVITTREDPSLPLARYRVRGQLTEVRASDLRFTAAEAAEFLNQVMGLTLTTGEIAALERRTEGWIAGLQLAALSMQGRTDVQEFIKAFTGDNRYVVDYLVEEVLQQQPEQLRMFLLQTSILDQLSAPLCDAVIGLKNGQKNEQEHEQQNLQQVGQGDGREMLETLERGNLFVIPLDDNRQWYRYHYLFADVLQARLLVEAPDLVPRLHQRASAWYAAHGLRADAIRHALTATDFEYAAGLIELAWRTMDRSFQEATWLGWVKALPAELIRNRPVLSAGYGWALLDTGELTAAEPRLQDAERWLEVVEVRERSAAMSAGMVVVDEGEFESLPATIAAARAYLAQALGDLSSAEMYARQALDLLPEDDDFYRGIPSVILGLAYWANGDLALARHSFTDAIASFQMAGNTLFVISSIYVLAAIRMAQGRLHEAFSTYQQGLQLAAEQGQGFAATSANLHRGISEIQLEWNDLAAAAQHLQKSEELGEAAGLPERSHRLSIAQADLKQGQGDLDGALTLLDKAARLYKRDRTPDLRPIAALKARVWIRQGRLSNALEWVQQQGITVEDELSYLREFEHLTLARVLIAHAQTTAQSGPHSDNQVAGTLDAVSEFLARLLPAAQAGQRTGSIIEILLLQALLLDEQDADAQAIDALAAALQLGQPEGYVRCFVDEGEALIPLLRRAATQGIEPKYVTTLLQALQEETATVDVAQPLVEPLSERELELLALVADGLSNQQIADTLVISLATTKKHMSNILGKLAAGNRTEAVRRAQDLQLLS